MSIKFNYGISCGDENIIASDMSPYRKKKVLLLIKGNESKILAYFRDNECVEEFERFFKKAFPEKKA